jgi:hypothetical protein
MNQDGSPPFVIGKLLCVIGNKPGFFSAGGIEFDLLNKSKKEISYFTASFMVFDAVTEKTPFIGANLIKQSFSGSIKPGELKKLYISLDNYMYAVPSEPYLIDFFYLPEIRYTDGSSWSDTNGIYYTRSY